MQNWSPGTDGAKMSKSKNNIIDVFLPDKKLRKQVMGIQTDSTPLEDPKDPDTCNVFALYRLVASEEDTEAMRAKYEKGGFGYGHAKQAFYEELLNQYAEAREKYNHFMNHTDELEAILASRSRKSGQSSG